MFHRVGLGPPVVDADVFLDGFFQFFFYSRLRLAEDIFDDGFSGFRIVTDCVAALPAAILSFADVPLAVCSSFWHGTFTFTGEIEYTLGFAQRIAHSGSQGQTGQIEDSLQHGRIVVHTVIQPTVCCFL